MRRFVNIELLFHFSATIAQEYDKFWVGLESIAVQVVSKDSAPPSSGISTTRKPLTSTTPSYKPAVQKVVSSILIN